MSVVVQVIEAFKRILGDGVQQLHETGSRMLASRTVVLSSAKGSRTRELALPFARVRWSSMPISKSELALPWPGSAG